MKDIKKLNEIIDRLSAENAKWREEFHKAKVILRRRAPRASGLTMPGAIETILNDRDKKLSKIDFYKKELRKVLKYLINGQFNKAKKELNLFLFKEKT